MTAPTLTDSWKAAKYPGDSVREIRLKKGREIGDVRIQDYSETSRQKPCYRVASFLPGNLVESPGDTPKVEPEHSTWENDAGEANIRLHMFLEAAQADGWVRMDRDPAPAAPTFTPDELAKLPRWATQKIAALEISAREAQAALTVFAGAQPPSRVEFQPHTGIGNPKLFAPDDVTIRFFLGDHPHREDWIEISLPYHFKAKGRYARAVQLRASGRIVTFHDASNSSFVTLADMAADLVQDGLL